MRGGCHVFFAEALRKACGSVAEAEGCFVGQRERLKCVQKTINGISICAVFRKVAEGIRKNTEGMKVINVMNCVFCGRFRKVSGRVRKVWKLLTS